MTRTRSWKPLIGSVSIAFAFVVIRSIMMSHTPTETYEDWVRLDTLKDIPRALGLVATIWLCRRYWTAEELGIHLRGWKRALVIGGLYCAAELWLRLRNYNGVIESGFLGPLVASSYLVGMFEELIWRGAVLQALSDKFNRVVAVLLCSTIVTVWHVQAISVSYWPTIFLFGVWTCVLRLEGVSLLWLAVIHGTYDSVVMLGNYGPLLSLSNFVRIGSELACIGLALTNQVLSRRNPGFNSAVHESL